MVSQIASLAGKMFDASTATVSATKSFNSVSAMAKKLSEQSPLETASEIFKSFQPANVQSSTTWAKTGAALKGLREAAGLTIDEVSDAINLKDPALIEALESGVIALPFELILRLAAVLGRNDPVGFIMEFTRASNPGIWRLMETLGFGKLLIQSVREREFANIYRGNDEARRLNDVEFAEIIRVVTSTFEMAMSFHKKQRKTK
jgi:transcriptional regulator with XRE-family HTH domain